jgi:rubredoxin
MTMHNLPFEIDCTACGCPDVEVQRPPRIGEWFGSGVARCNECGCQFSFRAAEGSAEEDTEDGRAVIYRPIRCHCPACRSSDVPVQRTAGRVRYHKCRDCGKNFKSVEGK